MAGDFRHPVRDYVVADVAGAALKTIGKARTEGQDKLTFATLLQLSLKPNNGIMC